MEEERKPLSLNERLALSLSRSRPTSHRTAEIRVRKVKLDGRRRLCKLSPRIDSGKHGTISSPGEKSDVGGDNIHDVVDDLSLRLETLSVGKSNRSFLPAPHESEVEYESAASSLSSSSSEEKWSEGIDKIKLKNVRRSVLKQDEGVYAKEVKENVAEEDNAVELIKDDCEDYLKMNGTGRYKTLGFTLAGKTAKMLYPHQREGLKWLWSLHCGGTGGILGDDMGLGKTMQISAFLAGLLHSRLIKRVLVVTPKTLLSHWMKELSAVGLSSRIREYSGTSLKVREYKLKSVLKV